MKKKILILLILLLNFLFINFTDVKAGELTCLERTTKESCLDSNHGYACVWNETKYGNYCNVDNLMYISCGDATDIPYQAPGLISFAVNLLKIATPIILIIISVISLLKALASSNEDEIKKSQKSLIRKLIAAAMVFFIISIVQFVIMKVADDSETTNISDCLSCFLNNDCEENIYYKTNIASTYYCTPLSTGIKDECETFNINNKSSYAVNNEFYQGSKAESCNGEYYGDYMPQSIMYNGKCHEVIGTLGQGGIDYVVVQKNLDGNLRTLTDDEVQFVKIEVNGQTHYFYWDYSQNKYIEFDSSKELITPYYQGSKAESCDGKYFENGYQPKSNWPCQSDSSLCVGGCTPLEIDNNSLYIKDGKSYNVYKFKTDDKLLSKDAYRYYWNDFENKYIYIDASKNVYNKYYQGSKDTSACAVKHGYWNGNQPKGIIDPDNNKCYKLEKTGVTYTFEDIDLLGKGHVKDHKIWKANNKCYYWKSSINDYVSIACPN